MSNGSPVKAQKIIALNANGNIGNEGAWRPRKPPILLMRRIDLRTLVWSGSRDKVWNLVGVLLTSGGFTPLWLAKAAIGSLDEAPEGKPAILQNGKPAMKRLLKPRNSTAPTEHQGERYLKRRRAAVLEILAGTGFENLRMETAQHWINGNGKSFSDAAKIDDQQQWKRKQTSAKSSLKQNCFNGIMISLTQFPNSLAQWRNPGTMRIWFQ